MNLANIEDDEIVIRIKIDTIPTAVDIELEKYLGQHHRWKVTDPKAFAGEMVKVINNETYSGDPMIYGFLGKVVFYAFESGSEGIEEK